MLAKTEFWQGLICTICVVGCFTLLIMGLNHFVEMVLTGILIGYVGITIGISRRKKK